MRICFVGDSFVNGTGDEECLGWAGRLCRDLSVQGIDVTYYNLGIRGETSVDLRNRWEAEVARRLEGVEDGRIVFSFGTNDTTVQDGERRVDRPASIENFRSVISTAMNRYPVLAISPLPLLDTERNERTSRLTNEQVSFAREIELDYLDLFEELRLGNVWMEALRANDGYHPFARGYEYLADRISKWSAWKQWTAVA